LHASAALAHDRLESVLGAPQIALAPQRVGLGRERTQAIVVDAGSASHDRTRRLHGWCRDVRLERRGPEGRRRDRASRRRNRFRRRVDLDRSAVFVLGRIEVERLIRRRRARLLARLLDPAIAPDRERDRSGREPGTREPARR
jgi:hypothetical protein